MPNGSLLFGKESEKNHYLRFIVSDRRPEISVPNRTREPHWSARRQADRTGRHHSGVEIATTQHHRLVRGRSIVVYSKCKLYLNNYNYLYKQVTSYFFFNYIPFFTGGT